MNLFPWTLVENGALVTAWPCPGPITSYFGVKDIAEHSQGHSGTDIGAPAGTPVYAPCDATVKDVFAIGVGRDDWEQTFGNSVILEHEGYVSLYAHLRDNPVVVEGAEIRRGTLLGYVGETGMSFGPHLHWGLAPASNPYLDRSDLRDPLAYCRESEPVPSVSETGGNVTPLPGGEFLPEQEPLRPPFNFWQDPLAARWAMEHEGKH